MMNNLLNEELLYTGDSQIATHLSLTSYNTTEIQEATGTTIKDISNTLNNNRINWLQVCGMHNTEAIRDICEHFEIDFLVLQDILNVDHPTKIEEHDNYMFVIMKLYRFNEANPDGELEQQQVAIVQGVNFVITFLEWESPIFDGIVKALHNNTLKIRTRQSDYLLSVVLNSLVANYTYIVNAIDDALEDLEEELLKTTSSNDIGVQIQSIRRQHLKIKKGIYPLKDQYSKLLRADNLLVHKVNRAFFNDVNDHLQFVLQTIEICRETFSSLVDLYISNNDLKRNDIMKRLTIVSTIFIPITFLAGVWGMNFGLMPELSWKYGYLVAWAIMIVIGGGTYLFFKKKEWY
ncbi:magnesium/cobalt transporter CorA [Bacteroides sp. 519]|uniref:magnesium/cobalt transporter CorA n=1 Tax=Bacteroides sp. 519 TaxID=2302937 RepID=UPI0013D7788A|nr:magnesium/cobalt transporter CorA [Bacteroides sp. 519]NDV58235.1 magnesium and cobalt transport protein CorA [Bacteroides sp. 519]